MLKCKKMKFRNAGYADILNVCESNSTKLRLYEEFQYNTSSAERFRNTTLINNSQQSVNFC